MKYSLRSLMQFSIRDVLWLMLVAALGFGWSADRQRLILEYNATLTRASELQNDARFPGRTVPNSSAPTPHPPKP